MKLLICFITLFSSIHGIEIDSLILKKFDGNEKFINLVIKCRTLLDKFRLLQHGKPGKPGPIQFKNNHYTVKELANLCHDDHSREVQETLTMVVNHIIKSAGNALEKMHKHQQQFLEIVKKWSHQRSKPDNCVLLWATVGDDRFISEYLTTFQRLDIFLSDAILLLEDLRDTLKKSECLAEEWIQHYRESHHKS